MQHLIQAELCLTLSLSLCFLYETVQFTKIVANENTYSYCNLSIYVFSTQSAIYLLTLFLQRGRLQTTLIRRGRQVVREISTVRRFSLITVKGQIDDKKGHNLDNVVKECPLKRRPVIVKVKKCFELSYPGWQTYAKSFFSNVCLAQMGSRNGLVRISILNRLGYNYKQKLSEIMVTM